MSATHAQERLGTRAFPRDLIAERWLINMHAYNLFMSPIFITYLTLIRVIKCTRVICCWQEPWKHSLPRVIIAWKSCKEKKHFSLFFIRKRSPIKIQNDTVLLFEQRGTQKKQGGAPPRLLSARKPLLLPCCLMYVFSCILRLYIPSVHICFRDGSLKTRINFSIYM